MNLFYTILVIWVICGFLNLSTMWLYHQAYLARKSWGTKCKDTELLGFFVGGIIATVFVVIGITVDLWSKLLGPALTKQVLFKPKPAEYPAKGAKCTNVAKYQEYYTYDAKPDNREVLYPTRPTLQDTLNLYNQQAAERGMLRDRTKYDYT